MDLITLQNILVTYIPAITVLLGFLAGCFGFLKKMKDLLKKSNIEEITALIHDENSDLSKRIDELVTLTKQLMEENQKLKTQNGKLLAELTRIADYEEE